MQPKKLRKASNLQMHLTLGMLKLPDKEIQLKAVNIFEQLRQDIEKEMKQTYISFSKMGYFTQRNH